MKKEPQSGSEHYKFHLQTVLEEPRTDPQIQVQLDRWVPISTLHGRKI